MTMKHTHRRLIAGLAVLVFLTCLAAGLRAQASQDQKTQFEEVLRQAEKQFNSGNYRNAAERYFFASKLAQDRFDFSRVYFGQALSYFYLKDTAQYEKYIKMVLEKDPRKEVSVVLYPISFVQAFERIRNEMHIPAPGPGEFEQVQPENKVSEVKQPEEVKAQPETPPETKPAAEPAVTTTAPPATQVVTAPPVKVVQRPGGHFEVAVHVSSWSINLIKGLFESSVVDKFGVEMRKVMTDDLRSKYSHFSLVPLSSQYEQNLALDSSGPNYGLEIRYYSRGWAGSFSVGLSFEQTSMKLAITGTVKQNYKDGSYAEADVVGSATASVFSTNLSFRWDILPASRVTPYFVLGLGWAPFKADVNETYTGTFTSASGSQESIENTKVKSVADIAADNDFTLPDAIFIVHLGFGLKVNIVYGLSGMVEAGLWDGFLLRFSVACRF